MDIYRAQNVVAWIDEAIELICMLVDDEFGRNCVNRKSVQLRQFCVPYLGTLNLFGDCDKEKLAFVMNILNEIECWTILPDNGGFVLNRKVAIKKLISSQNSTGASNLLGDFERYQIACWSCMEEEIGNLFEHFKHKNEIDDAGREWMKELAISLSGCVGETDLELEFWSHVMAGCSLQLKLEDAKILPVAGLQRALLRSWRHLEAVEYFWYKIKSLPESELSSREKDDILMRAVYRSTPHNRYSASPQETAHPSSDVFHFLLSEMTSDLHTKLFEYSFFGHLKFAILPNLAKNCQIELIRKLMDIRMRQRKSFSLREFQSLFKLERDKYHEKEAEQLFEELWQKLFLNRTNIVQELRGYIRKDWSIVLPCNSIIGLMIKMGSIDLLWKALEDAYNDADIPRRGGRRIEVEKFVCAVQFNDDFKNLLEEKGGLTESRHRISLYADKLFDNTP